MSEYRSRRLDFSSMSYRQILDVLYKDCIDACNYYMAWDGPGECDCGRKDALAYLINKKIDLDTARKEAYDSGYRDGYSDRERGY